MRVPDSLLPVAATALLGLAAFVWQSIERVEAEAAAERLRNRDVALAECDELAAKRGREADAYRQQRDYCIEATGFSLR